MTLVFYHPCKQLKEQEIITKPEQYIITEYEAIQSYEAIKSKPTELGMLFSISYQLLNHASIDLKNYDIVILTSTTNPSIDYPRAARPFYDKQNLFVKSLLKKVYQQLIYYKKKKLNIEELRSLENVLFIPLHWPSIPWHLKIDEKEQQIISINALTNEFKDNLEQTCNEALKLIDQDIACSPLINEQQPNMSYIKVEGFYDIGKQSKKNFEGYDYGQLRGCCKKNKELEVEALTNFLRINELQDHNMIGYYGRKSSFEAEIAKKVIQKLVDDKQPHIVGGEKGSLENVLKSYRYDVWVGEAHNSALNLLLGFLRKRFKKTKGFELCIDLRAF